MSSSSFPSGSRVHQSATAPPRPAPAAEADAPICHPGADEPQPRSRGRRSRRRPVGRTRAGSRRQPACAWPSAHLLAGKEVPDGPDPCTPAPKVLGERRGTCYVNNTSWLVDAVFRHRSSTPTDSSPSWSTHARPARGPGREDTETSPGHGPRLHGFTAAARDGRRVPVTDTAEAAQHVFEPRRGRPGRRPARRR